MEYTLPQLQHFAVLNEEDETPAMTETTPSSSDRLSLSTKEVMKLKCVEYSSLPDVIDAGIGVDVVDGIESINGIQVGKHVSEFFFYDDGSSSTGDATKLLTLDCSDSCWSVPSAGDSGLSSDPEGFTPPPLLRSKNKTRRHSTNDDEDSRSDISTDSITKHNNNKNNDNDNDNDNEKDNVNDKANDNENDVENDESLKGTEESTSWFECNDTVNSPPKPLPVGLLEEIRIQGKKQAQKASSGCIQIKEQHVKFTTDAPIKRRSVSSLQQDCDSPTDSTSMDELLHRFHLRENQISEGQVPVDDLSFVGIKDILSVEKSGTIRSVKGTVRGVRNRVRAGITTYLQAKTFKSYGEREQGKVVVYMTSMGVVRDTYQRCLKVQRILGTLLINYEERDVSMNRQVQVELMERMDRNQILVPQVFVEGQYLGDADMIEKLNEAGDLRQILRRYKRIGQETICDNCGGFRYLPCSVCNGSKKSIHRNHFTTEFVALKCINCNEAGLIRCNACTE